MDIVGCSKLPTDEQKRIVKRLQELVRQSAEYQHSRQSDQLISLPTGDGMALAFFNKLDAAVQCAIEVSQAIQAETLCNIRMGVHTGPVFVMEDINGTPNISGAGINRAERVMSCGDEGHILLSDNVAESVRHLSAWQDKVYPIGECRAKDGWVRVWNLVDGPIGKTALPRKSKRYAQRRQLLIALGAAALAVLIAMTVAGAFWMGRTRRAAMSAQNASIAVLPFADMSPDKSQEYFSDGIAEELMNGLAKTPGLRVAARTSSFQFKNKTDDSRSIGDKLNVATLLEGSVRRQGNRARVAVHLIKAEDGFELWSETFDRDLSDIFAVQEEIARAVAGELKVKLLGKGEAAKSTSAEAYNAYLQGRFFYARNNKANLLKAVSYFEQAVKLDPGYAPAWVGLADSQRFLTAESYIPQKEGYLSARTAAERALKLDPYLGEAHAAMGSIKMLHDWDWAGADKDFHRALELEPGDARAIRDCAALSKVLGRLDESLALYRQAVQLDPLSSAARRNLGIALYFAGRQQEAMAAFRKALELSPDMVTAHGWLARAYLEQSQPQEAMAETEKEKHPIFRLAGLALAEHALGRDKESDENLAELTAKFQADAPYQIAEIYAFRGEPERAFEWLERAYTERDDGLRDIKTDPLLRKLERGPRYAELLKKMRLPL